MCGYADYWRNVRIVTKLQMCGFQMCRYADYLGFFTRPLSIYRSTGTRGAPGTVWNALVLIISALYVAENTAWNTLPLIIRGLVM